MSFGLNSQVRVLSFLLTQTGTYQDQHLRPFVVDSRADYIDALQRTTNGGMNLSVAAVQDVAGNIIRPQTETEGVVGIAEGWRSRRFRFMMVVEEVDQFRLAERTRRVFFGYTDHCDANVNHLDPRMRIYFNSETIIKDMLRPTVHGPVPEARVVASNQIVSSLLQQPGLTHSAYHHNPTAYLIRPEDVFSVGQTLKVVDQLQSTGRIHGHIDMAFDSRSMVGNGGAYKYSARRDTSPTRYLADTLTAFQKAIKEAALEGDDDRVADPTVLYGTAQSHAANQDIHSNAFFAILKDQAGFMERGFITLSDLQSLFPETRTEQVTKYSMDDGRSIRKVNQAHDSNHWNGWDRQTIAASLLAQVVPAIMMDNLLRTVSFAATNGMGYDQYAIEVHTENTRSVVDGLNMQSFIEEFHRRLIVDILSVISERNNVRFSVSMLSDLAGDSVIDIQLDNEPLTRYVAPTFSDSLFAPVVTTNDRLQQTIANDLLYVIESTVPSNAEQFVRNALMGGAATPQPFATQPSINTPIQGTQHGFHSSNTDYSGLL